jgi:hypothetical protein
MLDQGLFVGGMYRVGRWLVPRWTGPNLYRSYVRGGRQPSPMDQCPVGRIRAIWNFHEDIWMYFPGGSVDQTEFKSFGGSWIEG